VIRHNAALAFALYFTPASPSSVSLPECPTISRTGSPHGRPSRAVKRGR